MGKKGVMPTYKTANDYVIEQSEEAQVILKKLIQLIYEAIPEAQELADYKVPSFKLVHAAKKDQQIMMMATKKFVGFYPFPETIEHFKNELGDYKLGKGSIQFPFGQPLPEKLIKKMIKYRHKEIIDTL